MSSSDAAALPDPKDAKEGTNRKSLGKYVKRMSSVFKREKTTKTKSKNAASPSTPALVEEKQETPTEPAVEPAKTTADAPPAAVITTLQRSALQQERARALFAKYGLTLESHEWITATPLPANVQRVEKPIRMRIHRTCHRCGTTYGADKVCAKCEHKRCKKCPRYPKKKSPSEKALAQAKEAAAAKEAPKKKRVLTITTKSGGELAYQPAKQRVRRTCHKCQALFIPPTATTCESCRHIRCTKCPREPAKLNKWPNGYPGDVAYDSDNEMELELERSRRIWRKPRIRVRWECEQCNHTFLEGSLQCPGCGHEKCDKCLRKPIKKVKLQKSFDPEVVKTVEAKLKALQVRDQDHHHHHHSSPLGVEAT